MDFIDIFVCREGTHVWSTSGWAGLYQHSTNDQTVQPRERRGTRGCVCGYGQEKAGVSHNTGVYSGSAGKI